MPNTLYLLYLDRFHREDLLFSQELARAFAQAGTRRPPCLLLHGSGEMAERLLEGEGYRVRRTGSVLDAGSREEVLLIERALREENKKLVASLTEVGVSAVGVHGLDRGLLKIDAGEALKATRPTWLSELATMGAVPVLSTLVRAADSNEVKESDAGDVIQALSGEGSLGDLVVVFLLKKNRPGIFEDGEIRETLTAEEAIATREVPEDDLLKTVTGAGIPVLLTNLQELVQEGPPSGTTIAG